MLRKTFNLFLLLLVPALYVLMGFFFHSERTSYYMYSVDPEYCYLFNAMHLAQFTLKVWHVDHPGTPIQFLAAIVIRVVHLFHGNGPLIKDVMQNSALYTKAINVTIFSLNGISLFFLGNAAYKYTKSFIQSIFIQTTPFASYLVLTLVFRINPENMATLGFILMGFLVIKYLQHNETRAKIIDKYLIGFAVIAGFSVAVKITFFPIWLIPLFLFKGFFRKILYGVFSIIAFLIFIFPVLCYRFDYFYDWIQNLFIHNGQYGAGEANVIDKHAYISALKLTFSTEYVFTISFFVFVVACIIYQIPYIKIKIRNEKLYKVLLGITASMTIMILLVAKQYKYHYLTPALLPISFGLWVVATIYFNKFKAIYKNTIFALLALLFLTSDFIKARESHAYYLTIKETILKTVDFVNNNPTDKPLVIVPTYYGCAYPQYALFFGLYWGGDIMRPRYTNVLNESYPKTYVYWWDELFHNWANDTISYIDLLKKYGSIRLYIGDTDIENNVMKHVMFNIQRVKDTKVENIFSNKDNQENIYEITYNPTASDIDSLEILCNADSLTSDGQYFTGSLGQVFNDGVTQSSEKAFSGKYSCKLSDDNKRGMEYIIDEVCAGDHYRISVWRNNSNKDASLAVSARNSDDFYLSETKTTNEKNDWGNIIIDFIVPENLNNKEIHIYTFNDTGNPAYFDDLKITKYKH